MSYKVIDNFLPEEDFNLIKNTIYAGDFEWYHFDDIANKDNVIDNYYYQVHLIYNQWRPNSHHYDLFLNKILNKMDIKSLIRVKINLFPNQGKFIEHPMHTDYDWEHKGALLSINSCDGYTKLEDGTKIDSVANRMLFFDSSKPHCSTNTTNNSRRVNINFNYF